MVIINNEETTEEDIDFNPPKKNTGRELVEVVRCKDCQYAQDGFECAIRELLEDNGEWTPDWYCADGKRKDPNYKPSRAPTFCEAVHCIWYNEKENKCNSIDGWDGDTCPYILEKWNELDRQITERRQQ